MFTNSTNVFLTGDLSIIGNTNRISEVSAVIRLLFKHLYFLLLSNASRQFFIKKYYNIKVQRLEKGSYQSAPSKSLNSV